MRRPPAVIASLVVLVALSACNDKITDGDLEQQASAQTNPELIPFASDYEEGEEGESPSVDTEETPGKAAIRSGRPSGSGRVVRPRALAALPAR